MRGSRETRLRGLNTASNYIRDRVGGRFDARKSRDAFERTSTPHRTVSLIVSMSVCCICTYVDIVLCLQLLLL